MLSQHKVTAKQNTTCSNATAQQHERGSSLLATCRELLDLSIEAVSAKLSGTNSSDTRLIFDLDRAAEIFGVDRQILLIAIVNYQLPAAFSDDRYFIKYKDLEKFLDCYYYTKNPMFGTYCPRFKSEMSLLSSDRSKVHPI